MQFVWEAFYKYIQKINCAHFIDFCVNLFRRCHSPRGHQKSPEDKCVERYFCHWKYCVFGDLVIITSKRFSILMTFGETFSALNSLENTLLLRPAIVTS